MFYCHVTKWKHRGTFCEKCDGYYMFKVLKGFLEHNRLKLPHGWPLF